MSRFLRYNLVYIFISIAGLALVSTSILNYYGQKLQSEYLELSFLAKNILEKLNTIQVLILEMESGQRGFILTGDELYKSSYSTNNELLIINLDELKSLASVTRIIPDDTVKSLERMIYNRVAQLDMVLEVYQEQGYEATKPIYETGIGRRMMNSIDANISYLVELENNHLDERAQAIDQFSTFNILVTQTGIAFTLVMLTFAGIGIYTRAKNNLELGATISKTNHQLTVALEDIKIKNQYIGMAAHDLRNPIGAVYSFSELLLEDTDPLTEEQRVFTEQIKYSAEHALSLVTEMLDVQKIDEGHLEHNFEYIDVRKLTDIILYGFKDKLTNKEISVNVDIHDDIRELIKTDKTVLIQVLDNLISNAIKFSYRKSVIDLKVSEVDNYLEIIVKDNGIGIAKENLPKLFQRFERIGKPTEGESSTGLGLSIIHDRIHQINGSIDCASVPGEGTEFTVRIPIMDK